MKNNNSLSRVIVSVLLVYGIIAFSGCQTFEKAVEKYQGQYQGAIIGDIEGIWKINIDENLNLTGELISENSNKYPIQGIVKKNGKIVADIETLKSKLVGNIEKKSMCCFGSLRGKKLKSSFAGFQNFNTNVNKLEKQNEGLFSVWELKSMSLKIMGMSIDEEYPAIRELSNGEHGEMNYYFLFTDNSTEYFATKAVSMPKKYAHLNGFFKTEYQYIVDGNKLVLKMDDPLEGKHIVAGSYTVTDTDLILEGKMIFIIPDFFIDMSKKIIKTKWIFKKVKTPTADEVKAAPARPNRKQE